jgi:hypothetical protein
MSYGSFAVNVKDVAAPGKVTVLPDADTGPAITLHEPTGPAELYAASQ